MSPQLPNPFTPLAFIPPDVAKQVINAHYILFGTLGAWLWDALCSLEEELSIFLHYGIHFPDVVYIMARLTTGWFVFMSALSAALPTGHCHIIAKVSAWAAASQYPFNSLLFLFRIRAVFKEQPIVIALFGCLWLGIVGTSIIAPLNLDGMALGTTKRCNNTRLSDASSVGILVTAVNDTLVFFAITTNLIRTTRWNTRSASDWLKVFLTGQGMGLVSRILLQTGQLYYLVTVGFNITSAAMILVPSIPPAYSDGLVPVGACITNMMATRVYRRLKLRILQDPPSVVNAIPRVSGTLNFRPEMSSNGADVLKGSRSASAEVGTEGSDTFLELGEMSRSRWSSRGEIKRGGTLSSMEEKSMAGHMRSPDL